MAELLLQPAIFHEKDSAVKKGAKNNPNGTSFAKNLSVLDRTQSSLPTLECFCLLFPVTHDKGKVSTVCIGGRMTAMPRNL